MADEYKNEVLGDLPLFYYRMEETTGTVAADSSGNANDGVYAGTHTKGNVKRLWDDTTNKRVLFTSGNISTASSAVGNGDTAFSIETIMQPTDVGGTRTVAGRRGGSNLESWQLRLTGGVYQFLVWRNAGSFEFWNMGSATLTYEHMALTYQGGLGAGSGVRFYRDGALTYSAPNTGTGLTFYPASARTIGIGQIGAAGGEPWNGYLDEFAYYNYVLPPERIATHANFAVVNPNAIDFRMAGESSQVALRIPSSVVPARFSQVQAQVAVGIPTPNPEGRVSTVMMQVAVQVPRDSSFGTTNRREDTIDGHERMHTYGMSGVDEDN